MTDVKSKVSINQTMMQNSIIFQCAFVAIANIFHQNLYELLGMSRRESSTFYLF